ncbi:MAG TPA: sugar ABC transporter permease [Ruminococcaceae bacterium]|nr:sugar ABC transporter permease [Oscillospiraceae bacterium]
MDVRYDNLIDTKKNTPNKFARFLKAANNDKYLYLMFLPPLIYYIVFHYVPIYGITLAFKEFDIVKGIMGSPWVGLKYVKQFIFDPYFWQVVKNTLTLSITNLVLSFPVSIILALMLNELRAQRFKKLVQTVSYLPHFISVVVVCGMIVSFLSSDGIVNQIITWFGGNPKQFLTDPRYFTGIYVISNIWQGAGWGSIIYLSALSAIDVQLYEVSTIDGANRWQQLLNVTLPGIMPTICIMFILETGKIMEVSFQKILLLLNGSNMQVADVISTYVYRRGIIGADFSYSAGVGLFQSLIALILILSTNAIVRKLNQTSLW